MIFPLKRNQLDYAISAYGKWAKMTTVLTQRTDNSIKNHWNSIMKKKISSMKSNL